MDTSRSDSSKAPLDTLTESLARLSALGWHVTTGPDVELGKSSRDADTSETVGGPES